MEAHDGKYTGKELAFREKVTILTIKKFKYSIPFEIFEKS